MPPEQLRCQPLNRQADLWAAGVVLWELLSGERLFKRNDDLTMMLAITQEPIPALSSNRGDISSDLVELVSRALQRSVASRIESAEEFRAGLLACPIELASHEQVAIQVGSVLGDSLKLREQKIGDIAELRRSAPAVPRSRSDDQTREPHDPALPGLEHPEHAALEPTEIAPRPESESRGRGSWVAPAVVVGGIALVAFVAHSLAGPSGAAEGPGSAVADSERAVAQPSRGPVPSFREPVGSSTALPESSAEVAPSAAVTGDPPLPSDRAAPPRRPRTRQRARKKPLDELSPSPY